MNDLKVMQYLHFNQIVQYQFIQFQEQKTLFFGLGTSYLQCSFRSIRHKGDMGLLCVEWPNRSSPQFYSSIIPTLIGVTLVAVLCICIYYL